jgi:putative ABC transport system permease protein
MNLSTARSAGRAREVGIRKVMGSPRGRLIRQFLVESLVLSVISMIVALLLVSLVLPYFNDISGKQLTASDYYAAGMIPAILIITLITGFLAGLYPALFISSFKPVEVLKGQLKSGVKSGFLRRALVVFQFSASIILIIGTLVVGGQLDFIRGKKLGFDKNQVLILHNAYLLDKQAETFKNQLLTHQQIKHAALSSYLPVPSSRNSSAVFPEEQVTNKNSTSVQNWTVDYDYIDTLGMKIVQGRNFSREFPTDRSAAIINQRTAKQFGWTDPVGKRLSRYEPGKNNQPKIVPYTVIGVVEDFHFQSLRSAIGPLVMFLGESKGLMSFRMNTADIAGTIGLVKARWTKFLPGQPFEYTFLDERFDQLYRAEQRLGEIFGIFAILAVFIGCLGLFGLAAFISQQRTREIGIRKVLGATVPGIVRLLSREFIILVGIANLIAWPVAYIIMNKWLEGFAYRAPLNPLIFPAAGAAALLIAIITTGYQALRAALADPVKSIKYE